MAITEIIPIIETVNKIIRLAAYCRVSSDSTDQLHSFATQIRYYKDFEQKNPQYKLVDIYADEGITGTSMENRDELKRLIRDCQKGLIDRVIVKSVSRMARNTQELLTIVRVLKDCGVSVYFEKEGIDTDKINSELIVTFPGMAAQQESEAISGNLRWSYKKRMESGEFNTTSPAYGFNLVNGELVINEVEAEVVRRIFDLYLRGIGKQTIAKMLTEEGIKRRDGSTKWHINSVGYILGNERYIGDALLQKKYTTDILPFRRLRNNGERPKYYIENANPAIIDKKTFEAVQRLKTSRQIPERKTKVTNPLTGTVKCGDCGRLFRRMNQGKNPIPIWICNGRAKYDTDCGKIQISEVRIHDAFVRMLSKLKDNSEMLLGTLIKDIATLQSKTCLNGDRIKEIDKEIADLSAQNLVIVRLHTSGFLPPADYSAQISEIDSKIKMLRSERKKKLSEDTDDDQLDSIRELLDIVKEYEPSYNFDAELYRQIVKSITVVSNCEIRFRLIGGIEFTERINEKSEV